MEKAERSGVGICCYSGIVIPCVKVQSNSPHPSHSKGVLLLKVMLSCVATAKFDAASDSGNGLSIPTPYMSFRASD